MLYRIEHNGETFTRNSKRTYTHAVLGAKSYRYNPTSKRMEVLVNDDIGVLSYCGSHELALKAQRKWSDMKYPRDDSTVGGCAVFERVVIVPVSVVR